MTPEEAGAELARLFSGPPEPPGKSLWHRRRYDLVRLPDGTVGFVRNALNEQLAQIFAEIMVELFGPEPAEDVELPSGRP
jgi:hypothetical protein